MNDVNIFNDTDFVKHSKLSNNPNYINDQGKVDSIELVDDNYHNKGQKNNDNHLFNSDLEMKKKNDNINEENNINNVNTYEDNIEKIDEESLPNDSYIRKNSSINKSYNNYFEKSQDDKIDDINNIKEKEKQNNLIMDEDLNISQTDNSKKLEQGMSEKNY